MSNFATAVLALNLVAFGLALIAFMRPHIFNKKRDKEDI